MKLQHITNHDDIYGTSFHNTVIMSTVEELTKAFGEPDYSMPDEDEKVQNEWDLEVVDDNGEKFPVTVYDWKEYHIYSDTELIEWHIGGRNNSDTELAKELINAVLEQQN